MKLTQKKIDEYKIELTITEDAAEFSKAIKRATKILGERVTVPGFRKGKIPPAIIERQVGKDAIIGEATNELIQKASRDALKNLGLIPVTENKADVVSNEEGKDFVFTLTFTPFPQVELGEYKNLSAEKVVEPVTEDDVNKQIEEMRVHHANLIEAAEGDAIVDGDFITLDYIGTINGEKFAGGEAKDQPLEIGSHKFIGNFEEQLIGAKVGEERTIKVTFPDEYQAKDLAGREAEFACKINSIKHRELPELNDEFAKKVSTFQTLDEYKADIRKNMEANAERRAVEAQQEAIIDQAVANMKVDLPPVMIDNRVTQMIKELDANLQTRGMKLEQYMAFSGLDMDKLREDYRESAEKNLLRDIMSDQIARIEKLSVTDQELNYEIAILAQMYRTPPKQIVKFLQENGQIENVVGNILRRKAMKFIIDNSAVAAKAKEEATTTAPVDETKVEKITPEVKQPTTPEVKQPTTPEVKQAAAPEVKQTAAPEVKQTAAPEVKQTAAPEVKQTAVPEVKQTAAPEVKQTAVPEVKQTAAPEVKQTAAPEVKQTAAPEVKQTAAPEVKQPATPTKEKQESAVKKDAAPTE